MRIYRVFLPFSPHSLQTLTSNASLEIIRLSRRSMLVRNKKDDNHITKKTFSSRADNYEVSFGKDFSQRVRNHHAVLDRQRLFLAQKQHYNIFATLFEWLQHCSNIATLCCVQNHRCESSHVTSPLAINNRVLNSKENH